MKHSELTSKIIGICIKVHKILGPGLLESVYEKAHAADLWIGVGSFTTLEEIKNADERYTKFNPYQTKQVFTFNGRKGAKGGSEFLELGYLRPDIILNDIVKIAHPELLPEYELYFHKRLE